MKKLLLIVSLVLIILLVSLSGCSMEITPDSIWIEVSRMQENPKSWDGSTALISPGDSESPHGNFVRVFINDVALNHIQDVNTVPMPDGAIIVKENFMSDNQDDLAAITVMVKSSEFTDGKGWYWIQYDPNGTVSKTETGEDIAGPVNMCLSCHEECDKDKYDLLYLYAFEQQEICNDFLKQNN